MKIEDGLGKRTLDVKGVIDGREHKQIVDGSPTTFIAKWNDDRLIWETKRETTVGVLHNRRIMRLAKDGKVITADRTRLSPKRHGLRFGKSNKAHRGRTDVRSCETGSALN